MNTQCDEMPYRTNVQRRDVSLRRLPIKYLFGDFAVQETPQWDVSTQGTACKQAFD